MSDEHSLNALLDILAQHSIDLSRDDVAWAFESKQTKEAIKTYIQEYLSPATLLSKEELQIHQHLSKLSHRSHTLESPGHIAALDDTDFERGLASLEQSTIEIERQCKNLETQRNALKSLQQSHTPSSVSVQGTNVPMRDQTRLALQDHLARLTATVSALQNDTNEALQLVSVNGKSQTERDDRMLAGLERMHNSPSEQHDSPLTHHELDRLCTRVVRLRSQALKKTVDSVFESAIVQANAKGGVDSVEANGNTDTVDALSEELDTLLIEVDAVLQMVVDHEHRSTILRDVNRMTDAAAQIRLNQFRYTIELLEHMTEHVELLVTRTSQVRDHARAVDHVAGVLELAASDTIQDAVRYKTQANVPGRGPSTEDDDRAVDDILRYFDVRATKSDTNDRIGHILTTEVEQRCSNQARLSASTERSFFEQLASSIDGVQSDLHAFAGALYAHTSFSKPRLGDQDIRKQLIELDQATAAVARDMAKIDAGNLVEAANARQILLM